jgi:hypothetical protein
VIFVNFVIFVLGRRPVRESSRSGFVIFVLAVGAGGVTG